MALRGGPVAHRPEDQRPWGRALLYHCFPALLFSFLAVGLVLHIDPASAEPVAVLPVKAALVPVDPAEVGPYRLVVEADGRTVRLEGLIDFGITRDLVALLEGAESVQLITLQSAGGRVAEARGLVKTIERFGLMTAARGSCASACALVFMSGHTRYLEPGARLGFHAYGLFSPLVALFMDTAAELEKDMAVFRKRDVAEAFIERIALTPHEAMWFPSPRELVEARVVDVLGTPD